MTTFLNDILSAITGSFTTLGSAIIDLIKDSFVNLFCISTESAGVVTITGLSPLAYYSFILLGIAIVMGLTAKLFSMIRRSR